MRKEGFFPRNSFRNACSSSSPGRWISTPIFVLFAGDRTNEQPPENEEDSARAAEPLPLSAHDLARLSNLRERQRIIPIMILDAMLPRQRLAFRSEDKKFSRLIQYCLEERTPMGMIGMNPYTGHPISSGVTIPIQASCVRREKENIEEFLEVTFVAEDRMEVQGEPWLDETKSFYLAEVEVLTQKGGIMHEESSGHRHTMSEEDRIRAQRISEELPETLNRWMQLVVETGATDEEGMKTRMASLGPMPESLTDRALWFAAVLNPLPSLGVALEIRPAMLSATNDLDRMILCAHAFESSIDHLSGKKRLF